MNKIILIGNVVHSPEMRTTGTGISVCKFSLAVRRRYKNPQTGEYDTDFFDVQAWRQLAELCGRFIEKGNKVGVTGSVQIRDYEGRDGAKRRAFEVVADEVEFLTPKGEQRAQEGTEQAALTKPGTQAHSAARASQEAAEHAGMTSAQMGFTAVDDDELPF